MANDLVGFDVPCICIYSTELISNADTNCLYFDRVKAEHPSHTSWGAAKERPIEWGKIKLGA